MRPVIGSEQKGCEVNLFFVFKRKDWVSVTGNVKSKRIKPVIGSKLICP